MIYSSRMAWIFALITCLGGCGQSSDVTGTVQGSIVCDSGRCTDVDGIDVSVPGVEGAPDLLPEPIDAPEFACDGLDDDGDGEIDEYIYGCETSTLRPAGEVTDGGPSDESLPGAAEAPDLLPEPIDEPEFACDGLDDDGDGEIDEYIHGCETSTLRPAGEVTDSGPSDESLPGAAEAPDLLPEPIDAPEFACDGLDDDGDGEIDEYIYGCETSTLP